MDCNRSESNRGKGFSLKTIINSQKENRKTLVPYELTQQWRRDIVKISPVINFSREKFIDRAIKKSFTKLLSNILLLEDLNKLESVGLFDIKTK